MIGVAMSFIHSLEKPQYGPAKYSLPVFLCLLFGWAGLARAELDFVAISGNTTGGFPNSVVSADLNGDGFPDLATANGSGDTVSVLLGKGGGSFQAKVDYAVGGQPYTVAAADLNGDGHPDLVTTKLDDGALSVLFGNGDGGFQAKVDHPVGNSPTSVVAADLNGDGQLDLAAANQVDNTVSVLLGNGDGGFQAKVDYPVGASPTAMAAADLDGDGQTDLATAGFFNTVSVLRGKGDGSFQAKADYPIGTSAMSVLAADLDGDGHPDLATANPGDSTFSVLLGKGDGSFQPKVDYPAGNFPISVAAADLNGDGHMDLAAANFGKTGIPDGEYDTVSVLLGQGDGSFQAKLDFGVGNAPTRIVLEDLNGDGRPELIAANSRSDTVSVLLNQSTPWAVVSIGLPAPFGDQFIGTSSLPQPITLGNAKDAAYDIRSIATTGDFAVVSHDCGTSLAAGATCTLNVAFTPTAAGERGGVLIITETTGKPLSASLGGTGVEPPPAPKPILSQSLSFGDQTVGSTSAAQAMTLANTGNAAYEIQSIATTGDFAVSHDCGTSLAAGATCTLNVAFTPTAAGERTGVLTVTGVLGSPLTASLGGTGIQTLSVLDAGLSQPAPFGEQEVDTTSEPQSITLSNTGDAPYGLQSIATTGDFAVTHDCGTSLAAGATCTLNVTFSPTVTGIRTGTLTVTGSSGEPLTAGLVGAGVAPGTAQVVPVYSIAADLSLKIASRKSVKLGKTLAYTIKLKNKSTTKVPEVLLAATLAEGATYRKVPPFCGVTGQKLACRWSFLGGKKLKTFNVKVIPGTQGTLAFSAEVEGEANDSNLANNKVEVATTVK